MAYSLEMIEWLHDNGKMPDWAYYQQNGKSADHNLREQRDRKENRKRTRKSGGSSTRRIAKRIQHKVKQKGVYHLVNRYRKMDNNRYTKQILGQQLWKSKEPNRRRENTIIVIR